MFASKYNWGNNNLAIRIEIEDEDSLIPLKDNLEAEMIFDDDYPNIIDAFNALKLKWEAMKWGYYYNAELIEIVDMSKHHYDVDVSKVVKDAEFDIWIYMLNQTIKPNGNN